MACLNNKAVIDGSLIAETEERAITQLIHTLYVFYFSQKIGQVTLEDLSRVGNKFVTPLFSQTARTAIVCNTDKAVELGAAFAE